MDKRVIFAVAGAGKTTYLVNRLTLDKRSLIVTYTENNFLLLRERIIKKFGFIPDNITITTYFTFLYSFCYKPFLHDIVCAKGINWDYPPEGTFRLKRDNINFYRDSFGRLYSNRIAKAVLSLGDTLAHVIHRIEKYYDEFFVDEVQDFGGHDFDLLKNIVGSNVNVALVGDFFQHTFDTSKDGKVNSSLYDSFDSYKGEFEKIGLIVDVNSLSHSHRCTASVCQFIRASLTVNIQSHKNQNTLVSFVESENDAINLFKNHEIVKLFFQNSHKYDCYSQNWGKSKGLDHYVDICVVLNATTMKAYRSGLLAGLPSSTKNKLYVACTRSNRNIFLVDEKCYKKYKSD